MFSKILSSDGGRNTKYYDINIKTLNWRRQENQNAKNDRGKWLKDNKQIRELVNSYYKKLFALDKIILL